MSFLWIALGLILGVNIGFSHARPGVRMIRRCMPVILGQLHPAESSSATQRQFAGEPNA